MLGYELLTGNSSSALGAEVILASGWRCGNSPSLLIHSPIPWTQQDDAQRSWNFYIRSWDMLDVLLAAYSTEQKSEWLAVCVRIALETGRVVRIGRVPATPAWAMRREMLSQRFTTCWEEVIGVRG
ncbi:DUF4113 domain-containing protein [Ectopseudomonas hydrolytica]|uniref:DUF4113 domain-containing protein n=1 Tax=Ectopseudomonas hydrolytica TaxID=2493633 RepID=UPI003EE0D7D6